MADKKDIENLDDIRWMVDAFYEKIRHDDLLGVIFNSIINDRWPEHLEKMYRFWQTLLLKEKTYTGQPFPPHQYMKIGPMHFERWLTLFEATVHERFSGAVAEEALMRARSIATIFNAKINGYS
ncbi:MAG: group III truncated hemoglobin [Bacteroidia bacterium]|nr:group III truncated hemoglobin [Bacteroidia bacterium]